MRHNPGVRRLASNPLLLTILALMKRQGVLLPERRVELYDKYVETLLRTWNLARSEGRAQALDVAETLRTLARSRSGCTTARPGVGLVQQQALGATPTAAGTRRGDARSAAEALLATCGHHAALLLDRGGRERLHPPDLSEYLAAIAIVQQGTTVRWTRWRALRRPQWHEVSVLTIAYLGIVQQRPDAAGAVLEALLAAGPAHRARPPCWRGRQWPTCGPVASPAPATARWYGAARYPA